MSGPRKRKRAALALALTLAISCEGERADWPPAAHGQSVTTIANAPVGVTLSAFDPESPVLTWEIDAYPTHGTLIGAPPELVYVPDEGYIGSDGFTFHVNDGFQDSNVATVSINVLPKCIWYVDIDAPAGGNGRSWAMAFRHPQDAVDAAGSDEHVWVAEGVYTRRGGTDTVVLTMGDGVAVYGGFAGSETSLTARDPDGRPTTLNGDADGDLVGDVYHVALGVSNARLDGFTLTRGRAEGEFPDERGAGMYNEGVDNLTVAFCTLARNSTTGSGGGMFNYGSSVEVIGCAFTENLVDGNGGGMFNSWDTSVSVADCSFVGNTAHRGGGMYDADRTATTIADSSFTGNSALRGGGAYIASGSSPTFWGCRFSGNSGTYGGGINSSSDACTLINCVLSGNSASYGAGIQSSDGSTDLVNCSFSGNRATYGGGLSFSNCSLAVTNCIFWGNTAIMPPPEIRSSEMDLMAVRYSDIGQPGYAGADGNLNVDPLFVDPDGQDDVPGTADDDVRLGPASECIDAGTDEGAPDEDIEGTPRPQGSAFDMGAYER